MRDLINQVKTSSDPNYCVRVTANDGAAGNQFLLEFRDNEKTIPTILTTSQKLSTGVDARNVRNIVLMRPINSIIEFKQIIGRGTRLYDGKDYFTIYDFVKASHNFSDPEWDGDPLPPEEPVEEAYVSSGTVKPRMMRETDNTETETRRKIRIKLADGKERTIQHMMATSFWSVDGTPMSATQFLESLYGTLPAFFNNEDELRHIWSVPATRRGLLSGLADKGFGKEALSEIQTIIDAENSDLFDVLAFVAFALRPITRSDRADNARHEIHLHFTDKQQAFLDFVLKQYILEGVDELDQDKLSSLLKLKYNNAISDAMTDLGDPAQIRGVFVGFQKYLYQPEHMA